MPTDKLKHPNKFPFGFARAIQQGEGMYLLGICEDKNKAKLLARKFRCFRKSALEYPLHNLSRCFQLYDIRTRTRQVQNNKWSVYIVVNRKLDLIGAIVPDNQ